MQSVKCQVMRRDTLRRLSEVKTGSARLKTTSSIVISVSSFEQSPTATSDFTSSSLDTFLPSDLRTFTYNGDIFVYTSCLMGTGGCILVMFWCLSAHMNTLLHVSYNGCRHMSLNYIKRRHSHILGLFTLLKSDKSICCNTTRLQSSSTLQTV